MIATLLWSGLGVIVFGYIFHLMENMEDVEKVLLGIVVVPGLVLSFLVFLAVLHTLTLGISTFLLILGVFGVIGTATRR